MNTHLIKYALIAFLILIISPLVFCQTEDDNFCNTNLNYGSLHIPTSTPVDGQFLRALFIYVTFRDDYTSNSETGIWAEPSHEPNTVGTRPINIYTRRGNLVSYSESPSSIPFMQRYEHYTISDFFCQMSQGKLDFIGDEVYFKLPEESSYYQNTLQ